LIVFSYETACDDPRRTRIVVVITENV